MITLVNRKSFLFGVLSLFLLITLALALWLENYWLLILPFAILGFYGGLYHPLFLFFILLATIPFSFEFNFSSGLGTDIPDEPLMWILSIVFIIGCLPVSVAYFREKLAHPLLLLLAAWFSWMILSSIFSSDPALSLKFILAKSWYLIAFVAAPLYFFREKKNILNAAGILLLAMVIVTMIILINHAGMGFSFATVNEAVKPFFRNHVNYAALLVCMIPVTMAVFILSKTAGLRNLAVLVTLILLIALYFSYSRGAWLAGLTGLLTWWLIKKRALLAGYFMGGLIVVSAFIWLKTDDRYLDFAHDFKTTIFHEDFSQHIISTYKLKDLSTEERFYRWIAGIRMVSDNWLTGTGPNTFYPRYKEYTIPAYRTYVSDNPERSTVHNYFLLTLVEQGLPGLLFLLLLAGTLLYYAEKNYHRSDNSTDRIIFLVTGTVFMMILVLNFLSDLVETDKLGSLFFVCIAVIISVKSFSDQPTRQ